MRFQARPKPSTRKKGEGRYRSPPAGLPSRNSEGDGKGGADGGGNVNTPKYTHSNIKLMAKEI